MESMKSLYSELEKEHSKLIDAKNSEKIVDQVGIQNDKDRLVVLNNEVEKLTVLNGELKKRYQLIFIHLL